MIIDLSYTFTPACDYTQDVYAFTIVPDNPAVTPSTFYTFDDSTNRLTIESSNLQDGTKYYNFQWTMTLTDTIINGGLTSFSGTARLLIINPCYGSELVPSLPTPPTLSE